METKLIPTTKRIFELSRIYSIFFKLIRTNPVNIHRFPQAVDKWVKEKCKYMKNNDKNLYLCENLCTFGVL